MNQLLVVSEQWKDCVFASILTQQPKTKPHVQSTIFVRRNVRVVVVCGLIKEMHSSAFTSSVLGGIEKLMVFLEVV